MKVIKITVDQVIEINRLICQQSGDPFQILNLNNIESAMGAAYYPGIPPFRYGGIAKVGGAMAFLVSQSHAFLNANKRTAIETSETFMSSNGWTLRYNKSHNSSDLATLLEKCSTGVLKLPDLVSWYDNHKVLK
jgi:prophage maintenance system killer protein